MAPHAVVRRCRRTEHAVRRATGLGLLVALAGVAPAAAQSGTGGAAPRDAAADRGALAPTASLYGTPAPRIAAIRCRSGCAAGGDARPGALVRLTGKGLARVDEVLFLGADADAADDASVAPRRASRKALLARVPRTAATGRLAVALADGTRSAAAPLPLAVEPLAPTLPAGVIDAEAQEHKVFFGGERPAELSYVIGGSEPAEVQVELIRGADGVPIASWTPGVVAPGVSHTVQWDGVAAGEVQRDGVYQFRVSAVGAAGVRAMSAQQPADQSAFQLLGHRFPVLGAHSFGEFQAAFGGGRGHQGQDVFAACGTPIVAARGGVVKLKRFQARAGHYLVIDGDHAGTDFVYMHLREAALVAEGDRVDTGQTIGFVGATGRASGCHLHFEQWTAPGWHAGGRPVDPLPDLKAWDAQS